MPAIPRSLLTLAVVCAACGAASQPDAPVQNTPRASASADTGVLWSVDEADGGGITAGGVYTAPATPGTYHVTVRSHADASRTARAAVVVAPPGPASAPVLYPADRTQSPIDATVAARLRAIAASGQGLRPQIFMKVGDSNSIWSYQGFMTCFDGFEDGTGSVSPDRPWLIYLDGRDALKPTIRWFRSVLTDGKSSYGRSSVATVAGTKAGDVLTGSPSTLEQEYTAMKPQYALIMFGSNHVYGTLPTNVAPFEADMRRIVDWLLARGVIPVLTTMPDRTDDPSYPLMVPSFVSTARAIAQGRQIPLIDVYRETAPLPRSALQDGVHLSTSGSFDSCHFRAAQGDLGWGMNVRNLITLQAIDRLKAVVTDSGSPPDPNAAHLAGEGTAAAPYLAASLPFVDMRSTAGGGSAFDGYACGGAQPAPGPERVYRLDLAQATPLRVLVLDAGADAVSVNALSGPTAAQCARSAPRMIEATFPAGTTYLTVDAVKGTGAEYTLSVTPCVAGDAACAGALH